LAFGRVTVEQICIYRSRYLLAGSWYIGNVI
jgi:hypothetical protein